MHGCKTLVLVVVKKLRLKGVACGVGVDFIPTAEHAAGLDETETHIIGCLPDYRNGIMEIIRFIRNRRVTIGFPLVQNLLVNLTTQRGLVVKDNGGDNCRQWRRCIKC